MSELEIRAATPGDRERWNDFLHGAPGANHYQRFEWLLLNEHSLGHEPFGLVAEIAGSLVGVLPLSRVRTRIFGDILTSMPFVNFGGPAPQTGDVAERLLDEAKVLSESLGCDYLEVRAFTAYPSFMHSDRKVSMTLSLMDNPDFLFDEFSRKHRKNIRRAERNDISVRVGCAELLRPFYKILERSWRAMGTPLYQYAYFEDLFRRMPDSHWIFLAEHNGRPVAGALVGRFGSVLEGMWAAQDPACIALQSNYVLYWEMIRWACSQGLKEFHLGRSTRGSGAQEFKARWLAEPRPLFWNVSLGTQREVPELNPDNPRFRLAMAVWRRLPLPILRHLGPPVARGIP
jgi:FemAB-related protein (PEP-CTERM system-associated)